MNNRWFTYIPAIVAFCTLGSDAADKNRTVSIPAGSFEMGYMSGVPSRPKHRADVDAFIMDRCEVTQGDYRALMGENPSETKRRLRRESGDIDSTSIGDLYPVTRVSWFDAVRYCNARSEAEGLQPCYDVSTWECDFRKNGYRLPTEAEWEYACRAGTTTKYFHGEDANELILYANYWRGGETYYEVMAEGHKWDKPLPRLGPVGQRKPNPWGLCDMLGNAEEWCNDWYDENYYARSPEKNPKGPEDAVMKVVRGGSYRDFADLVACGVRNAKHPLGKYSLSGTTGFRCVRNANEEKGRQ